MLYGQLFLCSISESKQKDIGIYMNAVLILAGGVDHRFKMEVPKQFVNVFNRPIIAYTMEIFQNHPEIDEILVSCLDGWQEMVKAYGKQFNITKLSTIIKGGADAQASTYNGLKYLKDKFDRGDIVIVHDAIRPMVNNEIISRSIQMCKKKGMGVSAVYTMDTIVRSSDGREGRESISRYEIMRVQTPQAYDFEYLWSLHNQALKKNCVGAWDNSMMITKMGETVYFSEGSELNLKINTVEDVEMFKALYRMKQDEAKEKKSALTMLGI